MHQLNNLMPNYVHISIHVCSVRVSENSRIAAYIPSANLLCVLGDNYERPTCLVSCREMKQMQDCLSVEGKPPANRTQTRFFAPMTLTLTR